MEGHGLVTGLGPLAEAIPAQIVGHQEGAGYVDAVEAGGAVAAPAAEVLAQLFADGLALGQLVLGERGEVPGGGGVAVHFLGGAHAGYADIADAGEGHEAQG